jgi:ATP-dependent protease ClpP protease subunit
MTSRKRLEKNDEIVIFYEHGLYIPRRQIIVDSTQVDLEHGESGVDAHMWSRLEKGLSILEKWPLTNDDQDNTITIVMNNPGGDMYHMLGMYDRICSSTCPIVIEASGQVMSAASIIMQAADIRRMHKHATMMIHRGKSESRGNADSMRNTAEELQRLENVMYSIYLEKIKIKNPKFNRRDLKNIMKDDKFISAQEAVELGLADEVIIF